MRPHSNSRRGGIRVAIVAGMALIMTLAPHGGARNAVAARASAEASTQANGQTVVQDISLDTVALAYDGNTNRIYASVPASAAQHANSIVVIDPTSGLVDATYVIGNDPGIMAMSDDGEWLYVFLNEISEMMRWHVPTHTPDIQFRVGEEPGLEPEDPATPFVATDLAVMPGQPDSVAVVSRPPGTTGPHILALYQNGVALPDDIFLAGDLVLEFGSPSRLYAFTPRSSASLFKRYDVSDTGLALLDENGDVLESGRSLVDIEYDSGLLYSTSGKVVDGETPAEVDSYFSVNLSLFRGVLVVEPSSADGVTYFILDHETVGLGVDLIVYHQTTMNSLSTDGIANSNGQPSHLIRTGPRRLAYRTTAGQVLLLQLPPDSDLDGIADSIDNCVHDSNPGQEDGDFDGIGDVCDPVHFSDMDGHWAVDSVEAVYAHGITNGCAIDPLAFCPDDSLTRAELTAFVLRATGEDGNLPGYLGTFSDVGEGRWYTGYVEGAAQLGYVNGYPDGTFRPSQPITRAELAVVILRALGEPDPALPVEDPFPDVPKDTWYAPYVARLKELNIISGYPDGTFQPNAQVSRAEVATIIERAWSLASA